jgi:hypothetical protein
MGMFNRKPTTLWTLACATGMAVLPNLAHAQNKTAFGDRGQIAFSDDLQLSCGSAGGSGSPPTPCAHPAIEGQSVSLPGGGSALGFSFVAAPAADYFVVRGLSLGAQVFYAHISASAPAPTGGSTSVSGDGWGLSPRIGYNIKLDDRFSLWPRLYVEYSSLSMSAGGTNSGNDRFTIGVFAPVLIQPVQHFYVGVGPNVATDLWSHASAGGHGGDGPKVTQYGLLFTVGGWFGPGA